MVSAGFKTDELQVVTVHMFVLRLLLFASCFVQLARTIRAFNTTEQVNATVTGNSVLILSSVQKHPSTLLCYYYIL